MIRVAKTKALIIFMVTTKLVSAIVFAYAKCLFSHNKAQIYLQTSAVAYSRIGKV